MADKGVSVDLVEKALLSEDEMQFIDSHTKDEIKKEVKSAVREELGVEDLAKALRLTPEAVLELQKCKDPKTLLTQFTKMMKKTDDMTLTEHSLELNARMVMEKLMSSLSHDWDDKIAVQFLGQIAKLKQSFFPPVQKSMNLNVDLFEENIKKWREEREREMVVELKKKNDKKRK